MPNAIVVFEAETQQLVYVNPAAESALDLSRKSLEGQSVHNLFGDNKALRVMISEVKQGNVLAQHQEMILHVIDNGPGIPEEIIERIFFPLVSGREGGGLGLTLAQTFVQQHQDFITCNSRPGRTDFHIQIPYRRQEKAS